MIKVNSVNQEQIKEINRANILRVFRERSDVTKQEICKILELSITTVTAKINELMGEGLIQEVGVAKSTGGRKPIVLKLNENSRCSIGVDVSPDTIGIIVTNLLSDIIYERHYTYDKTIAFDSTMDHLIETINEILSDLKIDKKIVLGIGMSLPGIIDEDEMYLENAPNIGLKHYCFKEFQEKIGLQTYLENDANIAAYAELIMGHTQGNKNVVYVSITEGIGTGIIIENNIFKSTYKKAGEFGHTKIVHKGILCNCGRQGCWEMYASKRALLRFYNEISTVKAASLEAFIKAFIDKDENAIKAMDIYIEYLTTGIENIILTLDPEVVIIGGEIAKYKSQLESYVVDKIHLESSISDAEKNTIIFSAFKDKGSLIGAGLLPIKRMFNFYSRVI